jgi:hypothetical protein
VIVELLFQLSNLLVLPFWLLMILLPAWRWTGRIVASPWIVAPTAALYAVLVLPALATLLPLLANPDLAAIASLLGTPAGATVAWAHFLAFDLFVGRWVYLDSRASRFSAWWVSPILALVLMFGPLGLLTYLLARTLVSRATRPAPATV